MKSKLITSFVMLLLGITAFAQTKTVTGTVVDKMGPVIGASVIEDGTTNGAITDLDGKFTIRVKEGAVLQFTSVGYATVNVTVDKRDVYNVTLEEDSQFLDEVVVVGYGTMKRSDLSGASVSMKEEDLKGSSSLRSTSLSRVVLPVYPQFRLQVLLVHLLQSACVVRLQSTQMPSLSTLSTV